MIVIINHDQVPQLQMPSSARSFASNTLHSTAITEKGKRVIVDQFKTGLIEFGSRMGLCDGKTNGVGETLAKRACGDLNTWGILCFWMTRGDAVNAL